MSMWYAVEGVSILKLSVCPTLTLIDVAKPWIDESPAPVTAQSLFGSPGSAFSQATGFAQAANARAGAKAGANTARRRVIDRKAWRRRNRGSERSASEDTERCLARPAARPQADAN